MEYWKVELTAGEQYLKEVKLKKHIFEKDALSSLLSVLMLIALE